MGAVLSLVSAFLAIDPGSTAALELTVTNNTTEVDNFEVVVEGLSPDWVTYPNPSFSLQPGQTNQERVLIRAIREPESAAGMYPFVLKIRSLNSGQTWHEDGTLEIRPYHQVSVDVEPKRLSVGGLRARGDLEIKMLNLSNVEHQLQLFASDPEGRFSYEFENDKLVVGPGQERVASVTLTPNNKPLIASPRLDNVSLSVRSVQHPTVAAYSQIQVEQRPLLPALPTIGTIVAVLLAVAWWSARPRPPQIEVFELAKEEITLGESVNVVFRVEGAKKVTLKSDDGEGTSFVRQSGEWTYMPKTTGTYTVTLNAEGIGSIRRNLVLKVNPAPIVPAPEILSFEVSPRTIEAGEQFTIRYQLNPHVARATLQPMGYTVDVRGTSMTVPPSTIGPMVLELIAENTRGDRVSRKVNVTVEPKTRAVIQTFDVTPNEVSAEDARVAVTWATESSVKVVLSYEGKTLSLDPRGGTQEIVLTKTTNITITATDSDGKRVQRSERVTVRPPVVEPDPEPVPDPATTNPPPTTSATDPVQDPT